MDKDKKIETSTTPYKSDSQNAPKSKVVETQKNNPMHGVKLKDVVEELVDTYGWKKLGQKIKIRCFTNDPSINSSLKFLRRTQWARDEVEALYLKTISKK